MAENPALDQSTSLSSVAALIHQGLRARDIDPQPLFDAAGIDSREISLAEKRFPTKRMQHLWRLALAATGDPCFGLHLAGHVQPSAMQGLGFAWLASNTLRDSLDRLARFSRLLHPILKISLEKTGETDDLVVTGQEQWPDFEFASADLAMAVFLRMCRMTAGETVDPEIVYLQRPQPPTEDCREDFANFFHATVVYDAAENRLRFASAQLDKPLPTPNPELARISDQTVVDYLARYDRESTAMRVRAHIIEHLPDGAPQQQRVANTLHLSLRSLQRRLKEEGTSFKDLLEETRRELALNYIRETHRPIGEITYLLGFSEPSNFTRAFRRWTGMAPAEYRERA